MAALRRSLIEFSPSLSDLIGELHSICIEAERLFLSLESSDLDIDEAWGELEFSRDVLRALSTLSERVRASIHAESMADRIEKARDALAIIARAARPSCSRLITKRAL